MNRFISRRRFLQNTSIGISALVIGCKGSSEPQILPDASTPDVITPPTTQPGYDGSWSWIRISADNTTTIATHKAEMGQGIATGLAMIIAEELGADWNQVQVVLEPEMGKFLIPGTGRAGTAESTSIRYQYAALRKIGATARQLFINAAASRWDVDPSTLATSNHQVTGGPDGASLSFGELVEEAKALPVPEEVTLKSPADFTLIGTSPAPYGLDDVVDGTRVYGIDATVEGMVYAAVRHAPVIGGTITNLDALSVEGTGADAIVEVPGGIAVVASSYWKANQVALSLDAVFDEPEEAKAFNTDDYLASLSEAIAGPGVVEAFSEGDADQAIANAKTVIEASYEVPFLAHACMEPMTATAHVTEDACEMWVPTQGAGGVQRDVAKALGFETAQVTVNRTYLGTGFGRKVQTDYAVQAAVVSQSIGKPVKLIWSREEDIRNDYYRPAFKCHMKGALNEDGTLEAWKAVSAGESILSEIGLNLAVDLVSVDGLLKIKGFSFESLTYKLPHELVTHAQLQTPLRAGFWRSVGLSQNTFFVESFIDELAHAAGQDPLEFRLNLLSESPRALAVVQKLKEVASWGTPQIEGASQGMAFIEAYESFFALAVEVTVTDGKIRVHRATGVVDCGQTIHPDQVAAQLEGGIVFGMGAGMMNAITVKDGRVQQSNFFDFPMPVMKDAPEITIAHIQSSESPGGVGELSVGPAAPAVANAVFQATGQRLRTLPMKLEA